VVELDGFECFLGDAFGSSQMAVMAVMAVMAAWR